MILADTSIWIDHFRSANQRMPRLLEAGSIVTHPFVVAELALGSLADRTETLYALDCLPALRVAHDHEVRRMIESRSLFGRGIGLVDAHLLASALIQPATLLWTADKRLHGAAEMLGISANFAVTA